MSLPAKTRDGRDIEIYDTGCTCCDASRTRAKPWSPIKVYLRDGRQVDVCDTCHSMKRGDL
jgi:hypothetical protein